MEEPIRYLIAIAYDGSLFCGWQVQPHKESVQGCLQKALSKLMNVRVVLHGSGRTDAGVHAFLQYAHFSVEKELPDKFLYRVNSILPRSIRVFSLWRAPNTFHARFSVEKKLYRYRMALAPFISPFKYHYVHVLYDIDLEKLTKAVPLFCGFKDFTSFSNSRSKNDSSCKKRRMINISIKKEEDEIWIDMLAEGFLYKMARNIVGTLISVGRGKISCDYVKDLFLKKDRTLAPSPAPSKALFLVNVWYPESLWQKLTLIEEC